MVVIDINNPKLKVYPRHYLDEYEVEVFNETNNYKETLICSNMPSIDNTRGLSNINLDGFKFIKGSVYYFTVKSLLEELIWTGKGLIIDDVVDVENYKPYKVKDDNIIKV